LAATYTFALIPISLIPFFIHISGIISTIVIVLCGIALFIQAVKLYRSCNLKDARKLMFYSIIYNPVVLLALFIDKI
jgi:protoheme IX farnesyltransferase